MLTKESLLSVSSPPKKIDVPELGEVFIRLISEEQAIAASKLEGPESRAKMACYSLCDEDGTRLFADGDLDQVRGLPFISILEIFQQAMVHNGLMSDEDKDAEKN